MRKLAASIYRSSGPVNSRLAVGHLKEALRETIGEGTRSSKRLFNAFESRALWNMPNNKLYELFEPNTLCKKKPEGFGKFDRESREKEGPKETAKESEEKKEEKEKPNVEAEAGKKDEKFDFKKSFGGNGNKPPIKKGLLFYFMVGVSGYYLLKLILKYGNIANTNLSYQVRFILARNSTNWSDKTRYGRLISFRM